MTLGVNRTCIATFTMPGAFTDETLTPGVTAIRAVHVEERRARIEAQRAASD